MEFPFGYQPSDAWRQKWYRQYPQLQGRFTACISGRLTRFKGHPDFIEAVNRLKQQGTDICGVIVGAEDPRRRAYAAELRRQVASLGLQNQIVFTGHRSDIRDVICACDVTVSTSVKPPESFGRAVLESLRLGKVTLGYAHGGVDEVLSAVYPEGRIPLRDIDALATRLHEACHGRLPCPQPGQQFLLADMQRKELELYQSLVESHPRNLRRAA